MTTRDASAPRALRPPPPDGRRRGGPVDAYLRHVIADLASGTVAVAVADAGPRPCGSAAEYGRCCGR